MDPKTIKIIVGVLGVIWTFALVLLMTPDHLKDGMTQLEEKNWDLAIQSFSIVKSNSRDFNQASHGINLAKAYKSFHLNKWSESLHYLNIDNPNPEFQKAYSELRDSILYHIDRDSISPLILRLKYLIQETTDQEQVLQILSILGTKNSYLDYIKVYYPNGLSIADYSHKIQSLDKGKYSQIGELENKRLELNSEIETLTERLKDVMKQNIRWHNFMIEKMFDQTYSEEISESKGLYSGFSMSEQSEIVVIAAQDEIPNSIYDRMSVSLLVKYLGNKEYIKGNAYGYKTNSYIPTYETVSKDQNPANIKKNLKKYFDQYYLNKELMIKLNQENESKKNKIVMAAINELKKSTWR